MTTDIIYLAWNRLDFTRITFGLLIENTDWDLVERLIVYDDGSTDGTREWLDENLANVPLPEDRRWLSHLGFGSPVKTMNHYLSGDPADWFVKLDNDIAVPKGWLPTLIDVAARHPEVDLLGMEAGHTWLASPDAANIEPWERWDGVHGIEPCSFIGGVGLMRSRAFTSRPAMQPLGRFGFTKWQQTQEPGRAWIQPDLLVPQLDRIPDEPFRSWSDRYVANGWQRDWPKMDPVWGRPYWGWMDETLGRDNGKPKRDPVVAAIRALGFVGNMHYCSDCMNHFHADRGQHKPGCQVLAGIEADDDWWEDVAR